ncbi:MAG TPA: diguanylate cyclase [Rhodocyclaceae bacterium]|nr:diguanylate cyclase [Rhodocyclaceae bacterium]
MKALALLLSLALSLPAWGLEKVALQLKWRHQFQFAGYYAAVARGFYREAGLEVELREARPDTDVVAEVLKGRAQFGTGSADLLLARADGKPVVALAVLLQHSAQVLLGRQEVMPVVQSLAGKRLMAGPGESELFAYLKQEGLRDGSYKVVPHSFDPDPLIAGTVDAMAGYSTDEPFLLRRAGLAYSLFSPRAAGLDFYGDNLFTSEALLKEKPRLVAAFRTASLRGWHYAMENPEEIADLILAKYSTRHSKEHLLFEAAEMARLMQPELVEIGQMNPGRWRHMAEVFAAVHMLPADAAIDGLIYDPRPPKLPAWAPTSLFLGTVVLVLIGAVAWRFAYFNRALNAEILARKEAEQIARASAENFRRLMDVAPVPVIVTGLYDDRILYLNEHARHAFGVAGPAGAVVGQPIPNYYRDPAQREQLMGELKRHGLVTDRTVAITNPRGEALDALVSARIIDFEGQPAAYTVAIDITERTRAEGAVRESEARALEANARLRIQLEEIAKLQAALKEQAIRDGLTGLYNRRYLDETLERELARAQRDHLPLCMVLLDIDHFKQLNDTYGHQSGDDALRAVAEALHHHVRAEDIACRYGGEEFLILMPHINLPVAAERAEGWRRVIEALRLDSDGREIRLTASLGVAAYPQHGHSADELTACADLALYAAKHRGRNQVVVFDPSLQEKAEPSPSRQSRGT